MKAEIYLSRAEREGMFKVELYLDGIKPAEARTGEFSQQEIVTLAGNFYRALALGGVEEETTIEIKNRGIEEKIYRTLEDQVRKRLGELNIRRNMN